MATIAALIVDVAANTAKLQTDVQKIHGQLDGIGSVAGKVGTMLAGAFTITAITGAASQVLNYASKLNNLSASTGLTRQALQEMQHAAALTNTSLDAFTNAAFKLGVNLAGGSNSVVGAVEKLGLSYFALQKMSPEQQFNTIAAALGTVQNAQERNKLAVELFGKAAKDILPAIAQGYDALRDSAITAGDAQLDALGMAGDALDSFLDSAKNVSVQLAGGLVIAVREATRYFMEHSAMVASVRRGYDEWGDILDTIGVTAPRVPRVLNETRVQAQSLPPVLAATSMSLAQVQEAERSLTEQVNKKIEANKEAIKAQKELQQTHERFAASVQRLDTAEFFVPFKTAVQEANFELEELAATIPVIAQQFIPLKAAVQQADRSFETFGDRVRTTMIELPNVILQAIQGGGSVIGAAGSYIGTSLMSKFQEKFGPAIKAALPFGIGKAINALLPTLGALFGPVAEKIGSFFRSIFGGPSADELRGRQAVADFEAQLHSLLTETQKLEAGNESWKMTVIAIRDAYIAQGLSENEALRAAERLWASSKEGGAASQRVIDEIRRIMEGGAAAAGDFAANLDSATRPRTINIGFNVAELPDLDFSNLSPGLATGSAGIRNFGSGTPVVLHGRERVQTEAQMQSERRGMGGEAIDELKRLVRQLPQAMKIAVADAMVLAGQR